MNPEEARAIILDALKHTAPEVDVSTLDPDVDLAEELDLDSMDFLNIVGAVAAATGRDLPERDYPQMGTLSSFVDYLARV